MPVSFAAAFRQAFARREMKGPVAPAADRGADEAPRRLG